MFGIRFYIVRLRTVVVSFCRLSCTRNRKEKSVGVPDVGCCALGCSLYLSLSVSLSLSLYLSLSLSLSHSLTLLLCVCVCECGLCVCVCVIIIIIINSLTARVVGAPQMILQPVCVCV